MAYDFIVFGADGLQGRIVSRDLIEKGYRVFRSDKIRPSHLSKKARMRYAHADLRSMEKVDSIMRRVGASVMVNCAEGDWNLQLQEIALKYGANYLDLGSDVKTTKKQFALDRAFKKKDLCAMTGMGATPGIGNIMMSHAAEKLDTVDYVEVGFAWRANMKKFVMPFSILSIIEELTEWPIMYDGGKFRCYRPQSGTHIRNIWTVGRQRIFLGASHPEPYTFYWYLKNKGVQTIKFYAGFPAFSYRQIMEYIKSGMGSLQADKSGIAPAELLADALRAQHPPDGYRENENLWVTITGTTKSGREKLIEMNCLAPTLKGWEEHVCNIDTGLPCSVVAQMIHEGEIIARGSSSPEFFVPPAPFFKKIAKHKLKVYENEKRIN